MIKRAWVFLGFPAMFLLGFAAAVLVHPSAPVPIAAAPVTAQMSGGSPVAPPQPDMTLPGNMQPHPAAHPALPSTTHNAAAPPVTKTATAHPTHTTGSAPHQAGKVNEAHPQMMIPEKFALQRLFRGIGRLDEEGTTPLTQEQAKSILAILTPLRTQATLTNAQAGKVAKQLEAVLTSAQRDAIKQANERRPRWGGGPGGAGRAGGPGTGGPPQGASGGPGQPGGIWGRPGGPDANGQGGGRRPQGEGPGRFAADLEKMNPFNPNGDNPMAQRMAERVNATFDALDAKAHGKENGPPQKK